jgi:hypothetical protein
VNYSTQASIIGWLGAYYKFISGLVIHVRFACTYQLYMQTIYDKICCDCHRLPYSQKPSTTGKMIPDSLVLACDVIYIRDLTSTGDVGTLESSLPSRLTSFFVLIVD